MRATFTYNMYILGKSTEYESILTHRESNTHK